MKRLLLVPLVIVSFVTNLPAQYYTSQNKIWAFGISAGIDFNSGSPVAISSNINSQESCASVCDSVGRLLFYSDGKNVYDKNGNLMPSGANIVTFSTNSAEQGALIMPVIGNSEQYYLFSLEEIQFTSDSGNCHLAYSIIDMTLNSGLGDVIA